MPCSEFILGRCVRGSRYSVFTSHRLHVVVVHMRSSTIVNAVSVARFSPVRTQKRINVTVQGRCRNGNCTGRTLHLLYSCIFDFLCLGRLVIRVSISGRTDVYLFRSYNFIHYKLLER